MDFTLIGRDILIPAPIGHGIANHTTSEIVHPMGLFPFDQKFNSRGRIFFFSHQKGAIIRGKAIIQGRRLFQIFLTEGRALNILF